MAPQYCLGDSRYSDHDWRIGSETGAVGSRGFLRLCRLGTAVFRHIKQEGGMEKEVPRYGGLRAWG